MLSPSDAHVLRWASILDTVDYFSILRLPLPNDGEWPSEAQIRKAFHLFANSFHPDRHRGSSSVALDAASRVFRVGVEAYRVLLDPLLGPRYLRLYRETGALRLVPEELRQSIAPSRGDSQDVERIDQMIRSASARPFAERADSLIASGELVQAKLQIQLALIREPQNARLQERLRALESQLATLRANSRPPSAG
ncbi:MAG: hypothetical protein NVSMB1_12700 [Polyangiales bacterium]